MTSPQDPLAKDPEDVVRASALVADAIGQLIEFWGFRRIMGRIWSELYLAPEPMTAKDLAANLRVSISLVSTTLQDLLAWGVVRRAPRPGGRADVYEAETYVWKMLSKVLKEREAFRLEDALERLRAAKGEVGAAGGRTPEAQRRKTIGSRIERLERLGMLVRQLVDHLLEEASLDVTGLKDVTLGDGDGDSA